MNDDELVFWMRDTGYDYDYEDKEWTHKTRSIDDESAAFRATVLGREDHPGSTLYELDRVAERLSERLDAFDSPSDVRKADPEKIASEDFRPFRPMVTRPERRVMEEMTRDGVVGFIRKRIDRLKDDVSESHERLRKVEREDEFEDFARITDETTEDTDTVRSVLKTPITWTGKRITRHGAMREKGRILTAEDVRDTGYTTVEIFASEYKWNPDDPEDLAEVKGVLRDKGIVLTGVRDRWGHEKFSLPS